MVEAERCGVRLVDTPRRLRVVDLRSWKHDRRLHANLDLDCDHPFPLNRPAKRPPRRAGFQSQRCRVLIIWAGEGTPQKLALEMRMGDWRRTTLTDSGSQFSARDWGKRSHQIDCPVPAI
ncbi:hypothetical protein PsYK624_127690 [Phanerochaete sordida]|uniref:Uncharacterized protein n=1 Tax=Phanerochaete sordida TaxID=48140 RepID=A0A9P3GKT7_9APHY|nr:hypothetical protein PsYK624_127690 [Phanerochaete sordida]